MNLNLKVFNRGKVGPLARWSSSQGKQPAGEHERDAWSVDQPWKKKGENPSGE